MSLILDIEQIEWRAVKDEMPDCDITVLICAPEADEPVWLGYYDGHSWFADTGMEYGNEDETAAQVTAWAPMPKGVV